LNRIPLPLLPPEIGRLTGKRVTYRACYNAVLDGRMPAERGENGRWTVAVQDLPKVAAELGCKRITATTVTA
jgi:hypothetical protein